MSTTAIEQLLDGRKSRNLRIRRRSRDLMSYGLVVFGIRYGLGASPTSDLHVGLDSERWSESDVGRAVLVGMSLVARRASAAIGLKA